MQRFALIAALGPAVMLSQRAGWSALGIVLGLAIAELCWRLAPHVPRTAAA